MGAASASTGPRRWIANLDMYKKVPADLMEGTAQGSFFSYLVLIIIGTLVFFETKDYMRVRVVEELALDTQHLHRKKSLFGGNKFQSIESSSLNPPKLQVKFNITMMDLKCEFATIDVVSVLGSQQNVSKHIQKWMVSAEGVQERYNNQRNLEQHDLPEVELHDRTVTKTLEELHQNGEDAVPLDEEKLEEVLKEYPFVFVDFFANWCSHCRLFAPTWERLAELMIDAKWHHHERVVEKMEIAKEEAKKARMLAEAADAEGVNLNVIENITYSEEEYQNALKAVRSPILVGKVDCVNNHQLCRKQNIMSYPTIRLFVNGELYSDFFGSRTVVNLLQFVVLAEENVLGKNEEEGVLSLSDHAEVALDKLNITDEEKAAAMAAEKQRHEVWTPSEHPGCQIAGTLHLNKVPGNFYIQAQSPTHSLEPTLTNVSHEIHYLYFVSQAPPGVRPPTPGQELDESQRAQDGTIMVPPPKDSAVSSLSHPMNGNAYVTHEFHQAHHHYIKLVSTNLYSYQILQNSQMVHYRPDQVPEAKFILDLSPIAVTYHASKRHWYDYVTSIMAIVGGTFTVVGIVDAMLRTAVTTTKKVVTRRRGGAAQQQNRELPRPPPQPTREAFQHAHHHDPATRPLQPQQPGAPAPTVATKRTAARKPLPRPPPR
jgi:thiol-disulfide isomerase/thioredoxin